MRLRFSLLSALAVLVASRSFSCSELTSSALFCIQAFDLDVMLSLSRVILREYEEYRGYWEWKTRNENIGNMIQ